MTMRNLRIITPIIIVVVAITAIGFSVAFAQDNGKGDSTARNLSAKLAEILGLDTAVVDDALKQAREELRNEAIQEKLTILVDNGRLTQEQADGYLNWMQSRPEGIPAIGKPFIGRKAHHTTSKGHAGFPGPRKNFDKKTSVQSIEKKLNAMVEDGDITQEEAETKLKALRKAKAD